MATSDAKQKVTVLLTQDEFARFDTYCRERGFKKSTLIAKMINDRLDMEGFGIQRGLFSASDHAPTGGTDR